MDGQTDICHVCHRGVFVQRMEHLTCFVAGNLALGVANGAVTGGKGEQYLAVARNLTRTCFEMYNKMPTGECPRSLSLQLCASPQKSWQSACQRHSVRGGSACHTGLAGP